MEDLAPNPGAIEHIEQMARKPFVLSQSEHGYLAAIPDGYSLKHHTEHLSAPGRKTGTTTREELAALLPKRASSPDGDDQ